MKQIHEVLYVWNKFTKKNELNLRYSIKYHFNYVQRNPVKSDKEGF